MATPKISLFGLVVEDMAKSLEFYRKLGVELPADADEQPHVEAILPGGLKLAWDTVETVRTFDPDWQAPKGSSRFAIAFEMESPAEVDAQYAALVKDGYRGHIEPFDAVWGQRYALVLDPDGNVVDLFAPLQ